MKNSLKKIIQSVGLRQSLILAVGNVGASGFSAISLIIFSRFLGPQSFGSFSVAFSLTQLTARLGDFGFSQALQRFVAPRYKKDPDACARAIQIVGYIKIITAVVSIILGVTLGPLLSNSIFHVSDPRIIGLGIGLASIIMFYEYLTVIMQSIAKFTQAIIMNASQAVAKCIFAIGSYYLLTPSPFVSYLGYGLAPVVAVIVGWLAVPQSLKKTLTKIWSVWPDLSRSAKFMAVGVLAAAIGDNVDVLMVNSSLTEYQTGLYSAAARVAMMLALFGMSFGTVLNTRIAQYQDNHHMNLFLKKALLFCLGSLILIPIALVFSEPLIQFTAGEKFLAAVPAMNYLIASSLVMMAIMPYIAVFYAVDYPAYFAIAGIIQTIVLIAANALLIPSFGIEGAGMAKLLARIVVALYTIVVAYHFSHKHFNTHRPSLSFLGKIMHD